ncbi:hypothetical protein [Rhizobium sp. RCAM05973]|uniref:hypothetical protein n=1 Tax=Rhizobium sp. RCAM05973 TaxID=2994066 RepID=UPI0022EBBA63|nr:hypothetical protein [Rhizobium sp. RCAM05973]
MSKLHVVPNRSRGTPDRLFYSQSARCSASEMIVEPGLIDRSRLSVQQDPEAASLSPRERWRQAPVSLGLEATLDDNAEHKSRTKKPPNGPEALASVLKNFDIRAIFFGPGLDASSRLAYFFPARQNGKSDFRMHRRPAAPLPSYWVRCRR